MGEQIDEELLENHYSTEGIGELWKDAVANKEFRAPCDGLVCIH